MIDGRHLLGDLGASLILAPLPVSAADQITIVIGVLRPIHFITPNFHQQFAPLGKAEIRDTVARYVELVVLLYWNQRDKK